MPQGDVRFLDPRRDAARHDQRMVAQPTRGPAIPPSSPTVTIPMPRAVSKARSTFGDFPLVVIPNSTSPARPRPESGRAKTSSNP